MDTEHSKDTEDASVGKTCLNSYNGVPGIFLGNKTDENIFLTGDIRKQVYAMKDDGDLLQYFDNHGIDLDGINNMARKSRS